MKTLRVLAIIIGIVVMIDFVIAIAVYGDKGLPLWLIILLTSSWMWAIYIFIRKGKSN